MTVPLVDDGDMRLYVGDAFEVLRELPSGSVHCCVTSPPFFGLRDYGVEGQIGLEASPEEWCARLVAVFREVRRVLRRGGTLWVEIGDSYNSGTSAKRNATETAEHGRWENGELAERVDVAGLKPKDLMLTPFLLAEALRADGWWLRQVIVWAKPNAMPESVTDRCTTSHSYVLLLAKSASYFFDAEAIAEPAAWERWGDQTVPKHEGTDTAAGWIKPKSKAELRAARSGNSWESGGLEAGKSTWPDGRQTGSDTGNGKKNPRSVWTIPTQGFPGAHFATFPEELVRRMILAGTSERGCCPECGAPWERETETSYEKSPVHGAGSSVGKRGAPRVEDAAVAGRSNKPSAVQPRVAKVVATTGWRPTCEHDHEPVPCTVLDPFGGSGTTALVARKQGRRSILIELSETYARMAAQRLSQLSLLAETS